MIPRPFEYERPESIAEAVALLADAGPREVTLLAGGQSLIPMLSLGLARPDVLVDLGALDLAGLERRNGSVRVGAGTTHRSLELGSDARELVPLASEASRSIGNPRVRNRGTFGGSLAHADPAAELGAVLLAYGGTVLAQGPGGERRIAADEFFQGYLTTALAPDEVLVAAELELPPPGTGVGFYEAARRTDDFATAGAAAIVTVDGDGRAASGARLALVGVGDRPLRVGTAEEIVRGEVPSDVLLERVEAEVEGAVEAKGDAFVSDAFRRRLAGVCARRALERAWGRAG